MHFAAGGGNAIELMKDAHFDVMVTDLRMPGVDGTALVAQVRNNSPETIRIVLSGYADEHQSSRLVSLAHRYLSKPCEPKRLEECIDRCLATQSLIKSETLRTQLGGIGSLPPMPTTFAALQRALADPSVDSNKVAAIIQRDPAIAAKVLQVCNSAFFRLPRRVSSIQQAVSYLGLSSVRSMVLSAEVFHPGSALSPALDLGRLQRHALNVAGIARSLATGMPWADDAFLGGLLHDVGLLLLGRQYPAKMQQVLEENASGAPLTDTERAHVGIDHGTAGAYLLGLWGLPYEVVEAVANHEKPILTSHTTFDVSSALAIAHLLLRAVRPEEAPTHEASVPMLSDDHLRMLGISNTWNSLIGRVEALLTAEKPT